MKKHLQFIMYLVVITVSCATSSFAIPLGTNITINDKVNGSSSWYGSSANYSVGREDNEVETNCVTGQVWDLEAFMLNGYNLSIVSGFNMKNGYDGVTSGDVFIDINGNAKYGPANTGTNPNGSNGNTVINNTFGYDYVLKLNFNTMKYSVYELSADDSSVTVYYSVNDESNPYRYYSGGVAVQGWQGVSFGYQSGNDTWIGNGLTGGTHNVATFDLGFLNGVNVLNNTITTHFTMSCGNDNLMGKGALPTAPAPVPEPATLLLVGSGLLGLAGFRRKNK